MNVQGHLSLSLLASMLGMLIWTGCSSPEGMKKTEDWGKAIHLGDSRDWLLRTHGPAKEVIEFPNLDEQIHIYGHSFVRIKDDRIFKWGNFGELSLEPDAPDQNSVGITQGSLLYDIVSTHGEPDSQEEFKTREELMVIYGDSWIKLKRGSVESWSNTGNLFAFDRYPETMPEGKPRVEFAQKQGIVTEYVIRSDTPEDSVFHGTREQKPVVVARKWPKRRATE